VADRGPRRAGICARRHNATRSWTAVDDAKLRETGDVLEFSCSGFGRGPPEDDAPRTPRGKSPAAARGPAAPARTRFLRPGIGAAAAMSKSHTGSAPSRSDNPRDQNTMGAQHDVCHAFHIGGLQLTRPPCVSACTVDCIHPRPDEPSYAIGPNMLNIDFPRSPPPPGIKFCKGCNDEGR